MRSLGIAIIIGGVICTVSMIGLNRLEERCQRYKDSLPTVTSNVKVFYPNGDSEIIVIKTTRDKIWMQVSWNKTYLVYSDISEIKHIAASDIRRYEVISEQIEHKAVITTKSEYPKIPL